MDLTLKLLPSLPTELFISMSLAVTSNAEISGCAIYCSLTKSPSPTGSSEVEHGSIEAKRSGCALSFKKMIH